MRMPLSSTTNADLVGAMHEGPCPKAFAGWRGRISEQFDLNIGRTGVGGRGVSTTSIRFATSLRNYPYGDGRALHQAARVVTEKNVRIGFIRLDKNVIYNGGEHSSIEILFQTKGRVAIVDQEYGPESAFEFARHEADRNSRGRA